MMHKIIQNQEKKSTGLRPTDALRPLLGQTRAISSQGKTHAARPSSGKPAASAASLG